MKILKSGLVAGLILMLCNCQGIEDLSETRTNLLIIKIWKFEVLSGYDDFGNQLAAAQAINLTFQFRPGGTYTKVLLGVAKDGSWSFNNNENVIHLDAGTISELDWQVLSLTDTALVISFKDPDALNGTVTYTFS